MNEMPLSQFDPVWSGRASQEVSSTLLMRSLLPAIMDISAMRSD
jgi:hypothetical protein